MNINISTINENISMHLQASQGIWYIYCHQGIWCSHNQWAKQIIQFNTCSMNINISTINENISMHLQASQGIWCSHNQWAKQII